MGGETNFSGEIHTLRKINNVNDISTPSFPQKQHLPKVRPTFNLEKSHVNKLN